MLQVTYAKSTVVDLENFVELYPGNERQQTHHVLWVSHYFNIFTKKKDGPPYTVVV